MKDLTEKKEVSRKKLVFEILELYEALEAEESFNKLMKMVVTEKPTWATQYVERS
jgi:hypothetical protein